MTINGSTNHSAWNFKLEVYENTYSVANNDSQVIVEAFIGRGPSGSYMTRPEASCVVSVTGCSDQTIYYAPNTTVNVPAYGWVSIGILTFNNVPHNSDGSKIVNINAVLNNDVNPTYASANGNLKLTDIPRQATITSAPNFNDESNPYISYSNPAGNSVTSLQACISLTGATDDIKYRDIGKTVKSYIFNLTEDERNILRSAAKNTNVLNVKFYVKTVISGNTYYSSLDSVMNIKDANPIFSEFSYKDTNTKVVNLLESDQLLVKNLSVLDVTILSENKMIAKKEAIPKNYIVTIDNINQNIEYKTTDIIQNIGIIKTSGTKKLVVRAYDSRNNSTAVEKEIFVYDYEKPVINATVNRLNNFENQTTLRVEGTFSSLVVDNVEKNNIVSMQYRYREYNTDWGEWINLIGSVENNKFTCNDVILSLDNAKAFDFEVKIEDKLKDNTLTLTVDIGEPIFFISNNKRKCYINWEEIIPGGGGGSSVDIVDNLNSTSSTKALSANQGRILNEKIEDVEENAGASITIVRW